MRSEWIEFTSDLIMRKPTFYDGSKKVFRSHRVRFDDPFEAVSLDDIGYTPRKLSVLVANYLNEESISVAQELWEKRADKGKYGSVGWHCYNHLIKAHSGANKISSSMGPCMQSMTLTRLKERATAMDVFYRTTEIIKKFPADLVFIQQHIIPRFDFEKAPLKSVTCHFSNITVSPTYVGNFLHLTSDPVKFMEELAESDERFWRASLMWLSRYIKAPGEDLHYSFNQARRVGLAVRRLIVDEDQARLLSYIQTNLRIDT